MGLADFISQEDRVNVKFSDFYKLMQEAAKAELIVNALNNNVSTYLMREFLCIQDLEIEETPADGAARESNN